MIEVAFIIDFTTGAGGLWNYSLNVLSKLNHSNEINFTVIIEENNKNINELLHEIDHSIKIKKIRSLRKGIFNRFIWSNNLSNSKFLCGVRKILIKYLNINNSTIKKLQKIFDKYDIIHYPHQNPHDFFFRIGKPIVINPHDFQHEYFPYFFDEKLVANRRKYWYSSFRKADALIVHGNHIKNDVVNYAKVNEKKVFVATYGIYSYDYIIDEVLNKRHELKYLPEHFILYPAKSWWHKNHLRLIDSIFLLKEKGIKVYMVFTDISGRAGREIIRKIKYLNLGDQIMIEGRISLNKLIQLFKYSTAIIDSSLYHQQSGPILEAINYGKCILAAKGVADNEFYVKNNGLLFDPYSIEDIAEKIRRIWINDELRNSMERNSKKIKEQLDWNQFISNSVKAYKNAIFYYNKTGK